MSVGARALCGLLLPMMLALFWKAIVDFRSGVIDIGRGGADYGVSRQDNPVWFWLLAIFYLALFLTFSLAFAYGVIFG